MSTLEIRKTNGKIYSFIRQKDLVCTPPKIKTMLSAWFLFLSNGFVKAVSSLPLFHARRQGGRPDRYFIILFEGT